MPTPERPYADSYTCTKCGEHKSRDEFYKRTNRKSGCSSECKSCHKAKMKARYKADPERVADLNSARKYGTSVAHIQQLREETGGICPCCGKPGKNHHSRLVVDHDHKTGDIRGVICNNCNSILGFCNDDIATLENLINYLKK